MSGATGALAGYGALSRRFAVVVMVLDRDTLHVDITEPNGMVPADLALKMMETGTNFYEHREAMKHNDER